jgi:type IV secretory pathway VirJ component
MKLSLIATALALLGGLAAAQSLEPLPANATRLDHGRFKQLLVYRPAGAATSFVLFLSGDEGWNAGVQTMALELVRQGAMVVGIDLPGFKKALEGDAGQCVFPDGDLENLSHFVQAYFHNPTYLAPVLVGQSSGGTLAYAALAQAPRDTFASALSLGFCVDFQMSKPLCKGSGLEFVRNPQGGGVKFLPVKELGNPWVVIQGERAQACPALETQQFVAQVHGAAIALLPHAGLPSLGAAFARLSSVNPRARVAPPPAELNDLPLIEVAARPGAAPTDSFAIIMSGDGGWAGLDQDIAAALSAQGIPVVGMDSLRYYWSARTPEGLAADTDRLIRYYLQHFDKQRVLLIGYSQGADVLPFAVNRLPEATRARVALAAILGMSEHALFEFHVSSWIADDKSGPATLPEVNRITGIPVLCIYGEDEKDSLCPQLDAKRFMVVKLKGGHHFDGDYAGLAQKIIAAARSALPPPSSRSSP